MTAIVSVPPGVTPTGTVEFFNGVASLGVAPVRFADGAFSAVIGGSALAVSSGPHLITARYSGDGAVPGNVSNVVAQVVKLGTYRVANIGVEGSRISVAGLNRAGQVAGNATSSTSGTQASVWTETGGFVGLGTLGGSYSAAEDISDTGMVVGFSGTAGDAETHPFAWTPADGMVDLGTFGGENGIASAIAVNNSGMVVGYADSADFGRHAFVWTPVEGLIDIGTLGGDSSFAWGVNSHGAVVGESNMADETMHALVWTRTGGMVDLSTLGGSHSTASAIDDQGIVIGQSYMAGDTEIHAFLWTEAGGMLDLGTLGGTFSNPLAVNANGVVVGLSRPPGDPVRNAVFETHAFIWTQSGGMVDLGTLGGSNSAALAINESGVVVGRSTTVGDSEIHAFMWTQATGMVDIGTPGRASHGVAVNGAGQVLMSSALAGFLLTPVAAETRTTPTITWTDPADVVFGAPLGAAQLNATTDVDGTFEYAPAAGTILNAGGAQALTATFTPADADNYFSVSATAHINVLQATPTITWSRPAAIVYGTPLGPQQLNATASVPGTFAYAPPAGTILPIGAARPLTVVLTPSDTLNYTTAAAATTVDVLSAGSPIQPPFQVLHAFNYFEGAYPASALLQASDKFFYGTTSGGGPSGLGTVFRMTAAGSITTLHSFAFVDGGNPSSGLIQARDGSFYGTTPSYGPNGHGTLYRIEPSGATSTVHAFSFGDGSYPYAGVIQASDGALYGTTVNAGTNGFGTIYRFDAGALTTLHSFTGADGAAPYGGLFQANDGLIYGTTTLGGSNGLGTVFRLEADSTLTTLHTFTYTDGAYPYAALIQATDGFLYGTTSSGGPIGAGTVFRMDAAGVVTTLHAFTYADGANPRGGLVQASDGFFYGTTYSGARAGTAYRMDAGGNLTTLRVFTGPDGSSPNASLIQASDGFLYGTTQFGGFQGTGTTFRLRLRAPRPLLSASQLVVFPVFSPYGGSAYLFATLASNNVPLVGRTVSFTLAGSAVGSALTDTNGFAFFGPVSLIGINAGPYVGAIAASFAGDTSYLPSTATGDLTVFKQTPFVTWAPSAPIVYGTPLGVAQLSASANVPGTFTYSPPMGTILAVGPRQTLSAVFTPADVVNYFTVTLSVTIDVSSAAETQSTLQSLFAFSGINGASPYAGLIQARDGLFYGATAYGGANGYGSVYRIDAAGALTTLHDFTGEDGAYPYGRLVQAGNGSIYGTTAFGGPAGYGTVFRMDGSGSVTMLYAFNYTDGASPYAGLLEANDGLLYGTTSEGGFTGYGTVFRIDTTGGLTTLHAFTNADGAFPYAALVQGLDGSFYGTTLQGGLNGYGVAYRMDAIGSVAPVHAFAWFDGAYPYAGLTQASDGSFHGTTSYGGPFGAGTVFRIDTARVTTMLRGFTFAEGGYPYSSVVQRSDGYFYGTTTQGGSSGGGTLYRMDASGTTTTVHEFSFADGAAPYGALIEGADGSLYGTTQDGGPHNLGTIFQLRLRAITQLAVSTATAVYGGTTTLSATLTSAGAPFAGREVSFTLNGSPVGTAITDGSGTAAIAGVSVAGLTPGTYPGAVSAIFAGDDSHSPSTASADLVVAKLTPIVTWPAPAPITFGTALDSTQLNATANVDGAFVYSPASGAILPVGAVQVLSVLFTPFDRAFYSSVLAYVAIDVVSVTPPGAGSLQVLHVFNGSDGANPAAGLTFGSDGLFYGTTQFGGLGAGTVYRMDRTTDTVNVKTVHAFGFTDGAYPYAGVIRASDGSLYGTTTSSGPGVYGTVYRVDSAGVTSTTHVFDYFNTGASPNGTLLQATDGFIYGTTYFGGPTGYGTIYRLDPDGVVRTLHAFTYGDGSNPYAGLIQARDGLFYGTTSSGGSHGYGTVFRMDAEGNVTTLHAFGVTDGAYLFAGLTQGSDGSFYGTTISGGPGGYGIVYRITAAGQLTTLHGFNSVDGNFPSAPPIQASDGFFYGTTRFGGSFGAGTIYRIDGGGQFTTLHHFSFGDGAYPYAALVQSNDGSLYGTTYSGGFGAGTVFRFTRRAASQLVASSAAGSYGGTTTLSATLTSGGSPLPGREVTFTLNGIGAGTATTTGDGLATLAGVSLSGFTPGTYPGVIRASFAGDATDAPSDAFADLTVEKATPAITWAPPAPLEYGTPLSDVQLNVTANVAGAFVYAPPAGTILPVGARQTLSVEFTPLDTINYRSAFATVTIDVVERSLFFGATDFGIFNLGGLEVPLSAIGGDGVHYMWSVTSGILPPGISIREDVPGWFMPADKAGLIGVATTPGTYHFTLRVTSGAQTFERDCTLRIAALLVSESYQLPDAFVGEPYSYRLSATGSAGPVSWTPIFVPPGMTLDSSGVLSGVPTDAGYSFVYLSASDGVDIVYRGMSLLVSAINITSPGVLPNATQFADYSTALSASGGSGGYVFRADFLPTGLALEPSGSISGVVAAGPGKWGFTVTATDSDGTTYTKWMSIDIIGVPPALPQIVPFGERFDDCPIGVPCERGIGVYSGGTAPFSWTATGLPPGMWIRSGSGNTPAYFTPGDAQIAGTPSTSGIFAVEISVTDALGVSATNRYPLNVSSLAQTDYLLPGNIGVPYSAKLRVIGGTPPYTVAQIAGQFPAGLSIDAATLRVSGTPIENGFFDPVLRFTDAAGASLQQTNYLSITGGTSKVTIYVNSDLGTIALGAFYSTGLFACCAASYEWSVAGGVLPPGVSLSTNGLLSGTPTTTGTFTFLVRAADAADSANYGLRQLTLVVSSLVITTNFDLPDGFVNTPFSVTLAATGGTAPFTFALKQWNYLPPGLTLAADGTLAGTPTASGQFFFNLTLTDAAGSVLTRGFRLSVYPEGATPPVRHLQGSDFDFGLGEIQVSLAASGGNGTYVWEVVSGSLPPGVALRTDGPSWFPPNASAGLVGVATTAGTFVFTLRATSGTQSTDQVYRLRVSSIVLTDLYSLPDAFVGAGYTYVLSAFSANGPITFEATNGLPPGMTLDSTGALSGTPTLPGFYNVNFQLTDGVGIVYNGIGLNVSEIEITTAAVLPNATPFSTYTTAITARGGSGGYTFTSSGLPPGLVLDASGTISGTVDAGPGKWGFTLTAIDTNHASYSKNMSIDIIGVPPLLPAVGIGTFDDCTFAIRCERTFSVFAGGAAPFTWSATGLPPGMGIRTGIYASPYLSPGDVQLMGAPTAFGTYAVTLTVTDAAGMSATGTLSLRVASIAQRDYLQNGTVGAAYSAKLRVIGGTLPYRVAQVGGQLPAGLSVDAESLMVSGTPIESGFFDPVWQFTDALGGTVQQANYFSIDGGSSTVQIYTPGDLGTTTLGSFYSNRLFACCAASYRWSVIDERHLPTGLSLSTSGDLSGTPTTAGTYTFLVRAADTAESANYGLRQFTLKVTPLSVPVNDDLPDAFVNSPYSVTLTATGGVAPYTWTLDRRSPLPPGLTLLVDGTISGTPTASGQFFIREVTVSDAAGNVFARQFHVTVYPEGTLPPIRHLQGPNFDFGLGEIQLSLAASGGNGTYAWELVSGSLPPGVALSTDQPSWFPANASAGLLGVATATGAYTFTLCATSGPQSTDQTYRIRVSSIALTDLYTLPDAFVGSGYSYTLSAVSANGPVAWAVRNLPPGLTLDSSGLLSGTPTASGFYFLNFRLTDGAGTVYNGVGLNVYDIQITAPGVLPNATQLSTYTTTLTATGGSGPYAFRSNALPAGLTLDPSGTISGTVTAGPGKFGFTVTATDTNQVRYSKNMSIDVIGVPPVLPAISPGNLDDCTVGVRCERTVTVFSGGTAPFTWTATGLPPGMSVRFGTNTSAYLTPGDAQLVGAPTAFGTYPVTVSITDVTGSTSSNTFALRVSGLLNREQLRNGTVGVPYSVKFRPIGGEPRYTVAKIGGQLPVGLDFDPATLLVTGTPLERGFFSAVFRFTDALGETLQQSNFFSIGGGPSTVTINTGNTLGTTLLGAFYSNQLSACCAAPFVWSVIGGTLPPGLSLSAGGALTGTPTAAGSYTFIVQAADAGDSVNYAVRQLTLVVTPLSVTPAFAFPDGFVNTPYSVPLITTGGTGPYTWSVAQFNYLPPGLTLGADGVVAGTPTASGQFFFTLTVEDSASHLLARSFRMFVYPEGGHPPLNLPFAATFTNLNPGLVLILLSAAGGVPAYHYSLTPGATTVPGMRVQDGQPLPTGFPPTVTAGFLGVITTAGTDQTSIRVTDALGTTFDRAITLKLTALQTVSSTVPPKGTVNQFYSFAPTPYGGSGRYSWSATNLPAGLVIDSSGQISGVPTLAGTIFPTVTLRDLDTSAPILVRLTLTVDPFAISTNGALPRGTVGTAYEQTLMAPDCSDCAWTALTALPAGFSLSGAGVLLGTPTFVFNRTLSIQASGSAGTVQKLFSLSVDASTPPPLSIANNGSLGFVTVAAFPAISLIGLGGTPPYSWSLESGALPPGLTLHDEHEALSANIAPGFWYLFGRATATGTYTFTLRVTDAAGDSASREFTWVVSSLSIQYPRLPITGNPLVAASPYSQALLAVGGTGVYAWANNAPLPPGLLLDSNTGVITGIPSAAGTFVVPIQVTDDAGSTTVLNVTFTVAVS